MSTAADLVDVLQGLDSLVIVCHDNPDPDCLASALALETIADAVGTDEVAIAYGGEISHQQNRAFVDLLQVDPTPVEEVDVREFGCVAFVDHSQPGVNTALPRSVEPDVVVDHHPGPSVEAPFADVRVEYGATSTIFVEYLSDLEVALTERLASALLFALHRERLDYVRDPTAREYEAALAIFPEANLEALSQLYGSAFSPETIDAIGRAINTRERRGSALAADVGRTTETDALPQAADYLLNLEGVDTVLVYGDVGGTIRISARSIDPGVHIGETLEGAVGDLGTAGGHHDMAGARIGLERFDDVDDEEALALVGGRITDRFFEAVDLDGDEPLA